MGWPRLSLDLALRSLISPATGIALVRVGWRFRHRHWYRRFPFLPVPAREYMRWRTYTDLGDQDAVPAAADVVRYARWAVREP